MDSSHKAFDHVLSRLKTGFAGVKLLALGQTVYWDEPMKAILRRVLDERLPETVMVVGIHDADYFSKVPSTRKPADEWAILPHNDASTRDLWVATGEISRLFGSETIPTRDLLVAHGVQIDKLAKDFPGGRGAFLDAATEAWGWRGLVHVNSRHEVSCDVPLRDVLPYFTELLEWGFDHSLDSLTEGDARRGRRVADELLAEVKTYADANGGASIAGMFRDFLPHFYRRLLGYEPRNLELTTSSRLFQFNKSTANLPRFRPASVFLDPATRGACQEAYDRAVEGSDIYTLDRFPQGAIPFDLVVPGRGRGTVCLRDGELVVDMDEAIRIPFDTPPAGLGELAALTEEHLGAETVLIGKALTLVLMMASEFIFVLNRQASAYVGRCQRMAGLMKERGINLPFYPILRIGYNTWDSLNGSDATFRLSEHLAASFGQGEITAEEFAGSWKMVVRRQEELLKRVQDLSGTDDLLGFLVEQKGEPWGETKAEYGRAYAAIRSLSERTEPMKEESIRLRDLSRQMKQEVQRLEFAKGEHFRENIKPLREELWRLEQEGVTGGPKVEEIQERIESHQGPRAEMEREIEQKRADALAAHNRSLELKKAVQALEKSDEAKLARKKLRAIEYEAELGKLWLVRDAALTVKGLRYANHRPTAWWFMLVDPQMNWFNRVAETVEFEFEEIDPP